MRGAVWNPLLKPRHACWDSCGIIPRAQVQQPADGVIPDQLVRTLSTQRWQLGTTEARVNSPYLSCSWG